MLKRIKTIGVASILAVSAVIFGLQSPAMATYINGTMEAPDGYVGTGGYTVDTTTNTLNLSATAYSLPAGWCVVAWLDIQREPGVGKPGTHYDVRTVRTCDPYSSHASGVQYEGSTYGIDIYGIGKLRLCVGPADTWGYCRNYVGNFTGVDTALGNSNKCNRTWHKSPSGLTAYYSGGNSWECYN